MKIKANKVSSIYVTNEYDPFKIKYGNRPVDMRHVRNLMSSMKHNYIQRPITINKKMEIIDGQHRFTAAKALGLPIYYEYNTEDLDGIRTMNQNTKNWTMDDFLSSYYSIEQKNNNGDLTGPYTIFKFFKEYSKFPIVICLYMLTGSHSSKRGSNMFKTGKLEIPSGQFELAKKQAKMILSVKDYYDGYRRQRFIHAMLQLFKDEEFDFKRFIKKLDINRAKMFHCTCTTDYIDTIEKIYNWGSKNKVKFRRYRD
jgi:hypothetical protein